MAFLLGFIPDEIFLIGIFVIVLGYVLGLLPTSFFLGAALIFILLFTPLLDDVLAGLSLKWLILLWIGVAVAFIRGGLGLMLGQRVADGLISHILRDLLVLPFKMIGGLMGMIFASLRNRLSHRLGGRIA